MRKTKIFIAIGIGIIIIFVSLTVFLNRSGKPDLKEEIEIPQEQENIKKEVVLSIDNGEGAPRTFNIEFKEGKTAFDLLKDKTEELNLTLKTKTYDIGILIEAIGDKENGQDGKYWLYYVNGEMPMVSADKKELKLGDKIEFKFEKSPF